jgi:hypothetical protein
MEISKLPDSRDTPSFGHGHHCSSPISHQSHYMLWNTSLNQLVVGSITDVFNCFKTTCNQIIGKGKQIEVGY